MYNTWSVCNSDKWHDIQIKALIFVFPSEIPNCVSSSFRWSAPICPLHSSACFGANVARSCCVNWAFLRCGAQMNNSESWMDALQNGHSKQISSRSPLFWFGGTFPRQPFRIDTQPNETRSDINAPEWVKFWWDVLANCASRMGKWTRRLLAPNCGKSGPSKWRVPKPGLQFSSEACPVRLKGLLVSSELNGEWFVISLRSRPGLICSANSIADCSCRNYNSEATIEILKRNLNKVFVNLCRN